MANIRDVIPFPRTPGNAMFWGSAPPWLYFGQQSCVGVLWPEKFASKSTRCASRAMPMRQARTVL
jgi:hypothetical protein